MRPELGSLDFVACNHLASWGLGTLVPPYQHVGLGSLKLQPTHSGLQSLELAPLEEGSRTEPTAHRTVARYTRALSAHPQWGCSASFLPSFPLLTPELRIDAPQEGGLLSMLQLQSPRRQGYQRAARSCTVYTLDHCAQQASVTPAWCENFLSSILVGMSNGKAEYCWASQCWRSPGVGV